MGANDYPVHISGETGTGKELVAAAIHNESRRGGGPFVPVNCGALPEGILESELFGHVKGAFTGAVRDKKGRFELANRGTLLLDEVSDLPRVVQAKLLRVLQEGTFERVGGEKTISVDVRIISASNRDLKREVKKGAFRKTGRRKCPRCPDPKRGQQGKGRQNLRRGSCHPLPILSGFLGCLMIHLCLII
jgi:transcriptional regulator with GAF, ATPase, and Fis domain